MSTSGSYDFTVNRNDLITAAHQYVGATGEGEIPSTAQITEAAIVLNMIVKLREADGMPLWALKRGYILPFTGASSIATDSHVVTTYRHTTTSAAAAAAATSIVVTSATGITAGDFIGIEQTNAMQWTTVTNVSSTTITLLNALTLAVASGADVYIYTATDRIQKPLRIVEADILTSADSISRELIVEDRGDYFRFSNRTNASIPNFIYYDLTSSSNTSLDTGQIFVYPRFNDGDRVIEFTYHRPFQDFDSSTDNPDFPPAFYLPLMLELASLLGPKFGVTKEERSALKTEAKAYLEQALSTTYPEGSLNIQVATRFQN